MKKLQFGTVNSLIIGIPLLFLQGCCFLGIGDCDDDTTTKKDTVAPVIKIIGSNPLEIILGESFSDLGATAMDDVDGVVSVISSGSIDMSTKGSYTLTYTASDKAGNEAKVTRTVIVKSSDTLAPVIKIIGDNPLEVTQGDTFADPGATATDNIDGTVAVIPSGSVDMSTKGRYTLTYTAVDSNGNKATATRIVNVIQAEKIWEVSNNEEFRKALEDASANGVSDSIVLSKGTYKTSSDSLGTFVFNDNEAFKLTIKAADGLTNKDVILDGDNTHRVFNYNNTGNGEFSLKGISIINGNAYNGGGFYSSKKTKIDSCLISNNTAENDGGGFYIKGITTLTDSTVSNNKITRGDSAGAGFYSYDSTIVTNSIISDNKTTASSGSGYGGGGGFYSRESIIVTLSTISNNTSYSSGGGFYGGSSVRINNSTLSNNEVTATGSSGGGFYSVDHTVINNSEIIENKAFNGGGFFIGYDTGDRKLLLTNSLLLGNTSTATELELVSVFSGSNLSYVVNNNFIKNNGSISTGGVFINNIFHDNASDISMISSDYIYTSRSGNIYNNYINNTGIKNNGNSVIKKQNIQPITVGDIKLGSDNITLSSSSPAIDQGLNPSSVTFKKIVGNDTVYEDLLKLLETDAKGKERIHNETIDIGAMEYGAK